MQFRRSVGWMSVRSFGLNSRSHGNEAIFLILNVIFTLELFSHTSGRNYNYCRLFSSRLQYPTPLKHSYRVVIVITSLRLEFLLLLRNWSKWRNDLIRE